MRLNIDIPHPKLDLGPRVFFGPGPAFAGMTLEEPTLLQP